jgi:hypothetical protein
VSDATFTSPDLTTFCRLDELGLRYPGSEESGHLSSPPAAPTLDGVMDEESRLLALGVVIDEFDFGREDEPDVSGLLLLEEVPGGLGVTALVRPRLSSEPRRTFAEWTLQHIERFIEHGPEPDGWQLRQSDGRWQLWARLVELPPLD